MTLEVRRKFYKWICYGILMFISVVLQTTLLSGFRVFSCAPSLIPFIVACIALHEGVADGMAAGLVGGIMCDAIYSDHEGFYTVSLCVLAFLICLMNTVMYWKSYGMALLDWAVLIIAMHFVHYCLYMLANGVGSIVSLAYVIPGEIITTAPFTPFLYMLIKKIEKSFLRLDD
ncbi:MAG: rod shape-determining protein MreD [Oscillospiraceae bacterium]|nr:rod shape-determining protein MreD [Oscillospiraceae bacterium]